MCQSLKIIFVFHNFFRKLPTATAIIAAEAHSGSVLPKDSEKQFLSVGRAETKQKEKKESLKQQKKNHKRKAEGVYIDNIQLFSYFVTSRHVTNM